MKMPKKQFRFWYVPATVWSLVMLFWPGPLMYFVGSAIEGFISWKETILVLLVILVAIAVCWRYDRWHRYQFVIWGSRWDHRKAE